MVVVAEMIDLDKLHDDLRRDEGCVRHAYEDSEGFLTIGVGRLIDQRRGGGLSDGEIALLLGNDIARVVADLDARIPWWRDLPDGVQRGLANMAFQLGIFGLLKFRKTLEHLKAGNYAAAATEALDSKWARQTPARAQRVAALLGGSDG